MQNFFVYSFSDLPEKERNSALRLGYSLLSAFLDEGGKFEEEGIIGDCVD
jgi:hypothetical protein